MDQQPLSKPMLWDRSANVQNRLREPKLHSKSVPRPESHPAPATKSTVLRAEAPEFVPTWLKQPADDIEYQFQNVHITVGDEVPHPRHAQAQDRFSRIRNTSQTSEHINPCSSNQMGELNGYADDNSADMIRLKQIISSLIRYPGQFDALLEVFMETIYSHFTDIMTMARIAELLVGRAISCPNFRYNGVRLCWYVEQKCPEFRAEIHLKCTKELQENFNQQNVVLFIAELYTQLPHDSLYGTLLIESLKKLLASKGNDNIKCVCQALKLTGYSLEHSHKEALDALFSQLKEFTDSLSDSALVLLNSVINLRESNWGRVANENSNTANSDHSDYDQDYEDMVNGILYETDGQTLTNEEQEFLISNDEYISDNEDPDALFDPEPEMDEEIQAAFEEFVKLSKG